VEEHLDEVEMTRLKVARDTFLSINPGGDNNHEQQHRKRHRKIGGGGGEQSAPMTVEKCRIQEIHWMEMWKDANIQLKQLRAEIKDEMDDVVRAEMLVDIEGLKKRKGDMAKLLGMTNDTIGDE
jgi:DNA polymerase sigma